VAPHSVRAGRGHTHVGEATVNPIDIDASSPSDAASELVDARASFLLAQERLHRAVVGAAEHPELRLLVTADSNLTAREAAIMNAMANGADNKAIGVLLFIGINTVKTNIRTAYRRMGVVTRAEAVRWTIQQGLDAPDLSTPLLGWRRRP